MTLEEVERIARRSQVRLLPPAPSPAHVPLVGRAYFDIGGREKLAALNGEHVAIVVDELGNAQYMILRPDGSTKPLLGQDSHLGAVGE